MPQHILYPKNWDVVLVVGWDPAFGSYYAQVRTTEDLLDDSEKYIPLWLIPQPGEIPTPENLEVVLNKAISGRWPVVRFTNNLISNLNWDKLNEENEIEGSNSQESKPSLKPPCVFEFYPRDDENDEYFILDIRDWFLDNYEKPVKHLNSSGGLFNTKEELYKNFGNVFSNRILKKAVQVIETDGVKEWSVAQWRLN